MLGWAKVQLIRGGDKVADCFLNILYRCEINAANARIFESGA